MSEISFKRKNLPRALGFPLRVVTDAMTISTMLFVISIYLAGLSFQISGETSRIQLLALATSSFVAVIVVLIPVLISLAIKRLLLVEKK